MLKAPQSTWKVLSSEETIQGSLDQNESMIFNVIGWPEHIVEEVCVVEDTGLGEHDCRYDHGQLHWPGLHNLGTSKDVKKDIRDVSVNWIG